MTTSPITNGTEFQINSYTTNSQSKPATASLADGGFVVTWASFLQDGSGDGIYGQRYDASGATLGAEFLINTHTTGYQTNPSITSLADGGFVVTWGNDAVLGQRYDASGIAVGVEFLINTYNSSYQNTPSITSLADGGFVVTWHSNEQDGDDYGVYGQRYDVVGDTVGEEFHISTYTNGGQYEPSITGLDNGGFVVTWHSENQDTSSYGIFGQRYDVNGEISGTEFQVNTYTSSSQSNSSITSLADGGFVVTWSSYLQDGSNSGIYGQRYDSSGVAAGAEFQINSYTTGTQSGVSVTSLADGGFVATWSSASQDGSGDGIFGQRYDANGDIVGLEFQINTYTISDQYDPSVSSLTDGGFVVTWTSNGQDGDSLGIYGQQFAGQLFGTNGADNIKDNVGADWINGQDGDDTIKGKDGKDTILGGLGNDIMYGGSGRDTIKGNKGNDVIEGGNHNDKIYGGKGNDTLTGGKGLDKLWGENGSDTFVFARASDSGNNSHADIIKDFDAGVDHIDLSAIGDLSFIGSAGFSGTAGELRVGNNGIDSFVRVDIDGDGSADMKIVLEGATGITTDDFIL